MARYKVEPECGPDAMLGEQHERRQRFRALVNDVRPALHRHCARMTQGNTQRLVYYGQGLAAETWHRRLAGRSSSPGGP